MTFQMMHVIVVILNANIIKEKHRPNKEKKKMDGTDWNKLEKYFDAIIKQLEYINTNLMRLNEKK